MKRLLALFSNRTVFICPQMKISACALMLVFLCNVAKAQVPSPALNGYWQDWDDASSPYIQIDQIDSRYNVVTVAFAVPVGGTLYQIGYTPVTGTNAAFISEIQTLQSQGKKVIVSIGGETDPVSIANIAQRNIFISSMDNILNTFGFDGVDIDFEGSSLSISGGTIAAPVDSPVVNLIAGLKQIMKDYRVSHNKKLLLTLAPETADVQGGMSAYAGIWGSYLPVISALHDSIDILQVQLYNTGSMYGIDGNIYTEGTADFIVAETEACIQGFSTSGGTFVGLPASKVAVGLPACSGAAGGGFTDTATVGKAMRYLIGTGPKPGSYTLHQTGGYPTLAGMMTWSINWDKVCTNYDYAANFQRIFSSLTSSSIIYTFTGSGNWSVASNWSGNIIPPSTLPSGSQIIINPSGTNECVLNVTETISAGATITVATGKKFRIPGDLHLQ